MSALEMIVWVRCSIEQGMLPGDMLSKWTPFAMVESHFLHLKIRLG